MELKKTDWIEVKEAYQRGEGSIRVLAERFGVSFAALRNRQAREKWTNMKKQFETKVMQLVEKKTLAGVEASAEELVVEQKAHIQRTLALCSALYTDIVRSREQILPAIDPQALDALSRTLARINEIARQSLEIPDQTKKVDVVSKGKSYEESFLSAIAKVRENPNPIKITSEDIDRILEAEIIDDEPT